MTVKEYKSEMEILNENKKACKNNVETLEYEMMLVSALSTSEKENHELHRLQVYVNDRYFINDEMINTISFAIKYLQQEKDYDSVYNSYLDKYAVLANRFIKISKEEDFKYLANKYMPNSQENSLNV